MFHPEKKYPGNSMTATGFKASDSLNAAFNHARKNAQAKSGGPRDAAVRLNEHPQVMRLFMAELLAQLDKDGVSKKAARIDGR